MFAKNLKYLRSQKGYTQKELADKLGYKSLVTVHHWENGTNACPSSKMVVVWVPLKGNALPRLHPGMPFLLPASRSLL